MTSVVCWEVFWLFYVAVPPFLLYAEPLAGLFNCCIELLTSVAAAAAAKFFAAP